MDAARLLGCTLRTIDYALDTGKLREVRVNGLRGRYVDATSIKSVNVVEELERLKMAVATAG